MESDESDDQRDLPTQAGAEKDAQDQRGDANATPAQPNTNVAPIVFIDHTNKRFVFPFGSCRTWDLFENLLQKTYARASRDIRDVIEKQEYDLLTINDEVIIPAVWDYVVEHHLPWQQKDNTTWKTIKISLWQSPKGSKHGLPAQPVDDSAQGRRESFTSLKEIFGKDPQSRTLSNSTTQDRTNQDQNSARKRLSDLEILQEPGPPSGRRSRAQSRSNSGSREGSSSGSSTGGRINIHTSPSITRRPSPRNKPPRESPRHVPSYINPFARSTMPGQLPTDPRATQLPYRHLPAPPERNAPDHVRFAKPVVSNTEYEVDEEYESDEWDVPGDWYSPSDNQYEDSSLSSADEDMAPELEKDSGTLPRSVEPPRDKDGNKLLFYIDTKWPVSLPKSDPSSPVPVSRMKMDTLRITKAIQVVADNRMSLQLRTLPGPPESGSIGSSVNIHWTHLHGDNLDFAQFKNTCLGMPGLSERAQRLARKTLDIVEKERLKMAHDGMFIEPGTVVRGEEKDRLDPSSAIFSCVPYFAIHPAPKSAIRADCLHPVRSLMQSYYPYEPVKERDMEQAYKKFSKYTTASGSSNSIIHVPAVWIINIGNHAVVTCSPWPLADDFVKSITVVQEDLELLAIRSKQGPDLAGTNDVTNIKLTIPDGRTLYYSLAECKTYFEMERKIREIHDLPGMTKPSLVWNRDEGEDDKDVSPADWPAMLKTPNRIFIKLSLLSQQKPDEKDEISIPLAVVANRIPPFFHWPHAEKKADADATDPESQQYGFLPAEMKRSMQCLEQVDRGLMTEKLIDVNAETILEKNFTSNQYYLSMSESNLESIRASFGELLQKTTSLGMRSSNQTFHKSIVSSQCSDITKHAAQLVDAIHETFKLFVSDVDKGTPLRKIWGAMANISTVVERVQHSGTARSNPSESDDPSWRPPLTRKRKWYIRSPKDSMRQGKSVPLPIGEELQIGVKKCRSCRRGTPYASPEAALRHLRGHLKSPSSIPIADGKFQGQYKDADLRVWIRNADQRLIEETNAAYLAIITLAAQQARGLLVEATELADGVRAIDGTMSDIYTLPHELLKTLPRLARFYLAIEMSFSYIDSNFIHRRLPRMQRDDQDPSSAQGLLVLERFAVDAKNSLLTARRELCAMARASGFKNLSERLSLSSQYLCAWFMRRLIVRPADHNGMTVTDMYRAYLLRLQFQVNHRPGKRLLRSLNLIQEELAAVEKVNRWQAKLISSYSVVLDDSFYQFDQPERRAMFAYEHQLLKSCLENLDDAREDCTELIRRCGPLSETTKQSAEINEEDHGKAILVFTVVTIIFLPLSFVTSYLGMNTSDIRDMDNKQSLFWEIAIPLTVVTLGTILFIAYNGEDLRRHISSTYRKLLGKQDTNVNSHGISVAQRRQAARASSDSTYTLGYQSLADEAEFVPPRPVTWDHSRSIRDGYHDSIGVPIELEYASASRMVEPRIALPSYQPTIPVSSRDTYHYVPLPLPPDWRSPEGITGNTAVSHVAVVPTQDRQGSSNTMQSNYPPPPDYPGHSGTSKEYTWTRGSSRTRDRTRSGHVSQEREPSFAYQSAYRPERQSEWPVLRGDRGYPRRNMRETRDEYLRIRNAERDAMRDAYASVPVHRRV